MARASQVQACPRPSSHAFKHLGAGFQRMNRQVASCMAYTAGPMQPSPLPLHPAPPSLAYVPVHAFPHAVALARCARVLEGGMDHIWLQAQLCRHVLGVAGVPAAEDGHRQDAALEGAPVAPAAAGTWMVDGRASAQGVTREIDKWPANGRIGACRSLAHKPSCSPFPGWPPPVHAQALCSFFQAHTHTNNPPFMPISAMSGPLTRTAGPSCRAAAAPRDGTSR